MNTERFQGQDRLKIGGGDSYLLLAPEHGGRLVRWIHRGEDMLYWPADADWTRVAKVRGGNPLLFPFIGRHFVDGEAGKWRDAEGVVRDMPQHGFARDLPFAVTQASDDTVSMTLSATDTTLVWYPFAFVFTATYRLLPDGLEATFGVRNDSRQRMPWYAGHHFYFALPRALRQASVLTAPATSRMRQTPDGGLTPPEPAEASYRLSDPRLQDTYHVLHDPAAPIDLQLATGRHLRFALSASPDAPWYAVTTWTESDASDFYCVEPWLGLPNAIHHAHGLRWVAPQAEATASCRLIVTC